MRNWVLNTFYFLHAIVLFQNVEFIIFYFFNYNILYHFSNSFIGFFFFFNYFIGIILFFWTFFYIKKLKWLTVLFLLNIVLEYFLVLYIVGDSF